MVIIGFIAGVFIGAVLGFVLCALMASSGTRGE
jgi:hypothetical protein